MIIKIVTSASLTVLNSESFQQASKIMDDSDAEHNAKYVVTASTDVLR